jgi:hypothetical protein
MHERTQNAAKVAQQISKLAREMAHLFLVEHDGGLRNELLVARLLLRLL